jgi:hypothetical protein
LCPPTAVRNRARVDLEIRKTSSEAGVGSGSIGGRSRGSAMPLTVPLVTLRRGGQVPDLSGLSCGSLLPRVTCLILGSQLRPHGGRDCSRCHGPSVTKQDTGRAEPGQNRVSGSPLLALGNFNLPSAGITGGAAAPGPVLLTSACRRCCRCHVGRRQRESRPGQLLSLSPSSHGLPLDRCDATPCSLEPVIRSCLSTRRSQQWRCHSQCH